MNNLFDSMSSQSQESVSDQNDEEKYPKKEDLDW